MARAREISAIVYVSMEIARTAVVLVAWGIFRFSLSEYADVLNVAVAMAFIAFAAIAFKQFSWRWPYVIAAFLVFYYLPDAAAFLYVGTSHLVALPFSVLLIAILAAKLAIAGLIYAWSVRHERAGAPSS